MKAKVFGIYILVCFTAPIVISFATLHLQKYNIRREVKREMIARIDRTELLLLRFTEEEKSQLNWEHSREFEFKGKMYDVVETEVKGDTTFYWCWEDDDETFLNQKLNELVAYALGHNPQKQESQKRMQSFFKSLYFSSTPEKNEFLST